MSYTPVRMTDSTRNDLQALDLAFLGSLLPGIIHNWATPLSGVIGATQLLERRVSIIQDLLSHYETLTAAERDELHRQLDRNRTNVDILSRNAQHLADLLQVLVQRITRGNGSARDAFPLHELVQSELRFLDANLQFKHKAKKCITLNPVTPASPFSYGYVAAVIDELVTSAIGAHDFAKGQIEMDFSTGAEHNVADIRLAMRFIAIAPTESLPGPMPVYLERLKEDGWTVEYASDSGTMTLRLSRPERPPLDR